MAKHRLKMLPAGLLALVSLVVRGALASSPGAADSMPSPSADVELICHTDNPAECYPKVFQATDEFRVVHHDQDIPPGLHVRLNVYTGKKEAKIAVPDEDNPPLEGVPVDSSVVIVERDSLNANEQVQIPPQAPAYDPAGKIKTPQSANADEGSAFYRSLAILKKGLDVHAALEMLEDISHDIYYGLKIAEDYDTVRELFCLAGSFSSPSAPGGSPHGRSLRARLAALTLASTVQNNPKALAEISHHWAKLSSERCSPSSTDQPLLGELTFRPIHQHHNPSLSSSPTKSSATAGGGEPSLLKARITFLSGLLKSPTIRRVFLASDGPSHLLQVLTLATTTASSSTTSSAAASASTNAEPQPPVDAWEPARRAAAFLLLDNFLDGDMGAALGEWPRSTQASDGECAASFAAAAAAASSSSSSSSSIPSSAAAADDKQRGGGAGAGLEECWDWHIWRLAQRYKGDKGHWSHELRERLVEQRRLNLAASTKGGKKSGMKSGKEEL